MSRAPSHTSGTLKQRLRLSSDSVDIYLYFCVRKLGGMFVFIVWVRKKKQNLSEEVLGCRETFQWSLFNCTVCTFSFYCAAVSRCCKMFGNKSDGSAWVTAAAALRQCLESKVIVKLGKKKANVLHKHWKNTQIKQTDVSSALSSRLVWTQSGLNGIFMAFPCSSDTPGISMSASRNIIITNKALLVAEFALGVSQMQRTSFSAVTRCRYAHTRANSIAKYVCVVDFIHSCPLAQCHPAWTLL